MIIRRHTWLESATVNCLSQPCNLTYLGEICGNKKKLKNYVIDSEYVIRRSWIKQVIEQGFPHYWENQEHTNIPSSLDSLRHKLLFKANQSMISCTTRYVLFCTWACLISNPPYNYKKPFLYWFKNKIPVQKQWAHYIMKAWFQVCGIPQNIAYQVLCLHGN